MSPADSLARLALCRAEGVGPLGHARLLARHGSAEEALASLGEAGRAAREAAAPEHEAVLSGGGRWLHRGALDYPPLLALTEDAPAVLALLGDPALLARRAVAVVGARNASAGGRRIAEDVAEALSEAGVAVVSGLARGVDTAAHEGGLRGPGRTVGVVPGGLDVAYPPENRALQRRIAEEGALLAESPLGTAPIARHFPRRNRIVAGLSLAVVVVEAAFRSGTLITARLAGEAGREILAVPGSPLDPRCLGSNDLLRGGARLCETAEDVLAVLPPDPDAPAPRPPPPPPPEPDEPPEGAEAHLLALLGPTPVPVDEVLRRCHLSAPAARAALLELELAGRVRSLPGNRVARSGA